MFCVCVLWLVIMGVLIAWVHYGECKHGGAMLDAVNMDGLCWVQSAWVGYAGCSQHG